MRQKRKTLNDIFPNFLAGEGIFRYLEDMPWDVSSYSLDFDYFGNISGEKSISPLVSKVLHEDEVLSEEKKKSLANIIKALYLPNWTRVWNVLTADYDPIENYNMIEEGTDNRKIANNREEEGKINRKENLSKDTSNTVDTEQENNGTTEDKVSAFNSDEYSPSSQNREETKQKGKETQTGSETNDNAITDEENRKHKESGTDDLTHKLTRHGNIGVTTSQQMLTSELEVRKTNFFRDIVYKDIDKVLTIGVY